MADATPQQHAEALEKALSFCRDDNLSYRFGEPNEYGTDCWEIDREELGLSELATVYSAERAALICAAVNAARSLLDERKRLREALQKIRDFNPSDHDVEDDEWGEVWAFGKCCEIAQEALK